MNTRKICRKMSKTMTLHYIKLFYRSALLLAALVFYIINRINHTGSLFGGMEHNDVILTIIWLVFAVEMLLRFFSFQIGKHGLPEAVCPQLCANADWWIRSTAFISEENGTDCRSMVFAKRDNRTALFITYYRCGNFIID